MNLFGAELPVGDDDGEYDENSHRILVVDAVGEVIVVSLDAKYQYGHSRDHAEDIHALLDGRCALLD